MKAGDWIDASQAGLTNLQSPAANVQPQTNSRPSALEGTETRTHGTERRRDKNTRRMNVEKGLGKVNFTRQQCHETSGNHTLTGQEGAGSVLGLL